MATSSHKLSMFLSPFYFTLAFNFLFGEVSPPRISQKHSNVPHNEFKLIDDSALGLASDAEEQTMLMEIVSSFPVFSPEPLCLSQPK